MRVEFNQGVPKGCIEWLYENVGRGNMNVIQDSDDYAWFYERVSIPVPIGDAEPYHVPTITVKDPKLAMLFVLRWAS
jgi:hypothetical protein